MTTIDVVKSGIVFRNPKPHLCSRHAYFPSLIALPTGELLCTMDIGSAFEAVDVRSFLCRSADGGTVWSSPAPIFGTDEIDHPVSTTCRVTRTPEGELVGLVCLFDRTRRDEGLANPQTEGFVRTDLALIRSMDEGLTWSGLEPLTSPDGWRHFETCAPITALPGGRWLAPSSYWNDWQGRCPAGAHKAVVFVSDDAGRSWPRIADVMDGTAEQVAAWEQKHVVLTDGHLMALCWCYDLRSRRNMPNRYVFSSDQGDSWSRPLSSPLHGETCTPVALSDNHVLCVYRRADKRGLWAHLARIEGDRWIGLSDVPLWGTDIESRDESKDSALSSLSTLRFGLPTVKRLPDGDVFAAFWCVEDCVSNIRWFRLRLAG